MPYISSTWCNLCNAGAVFHVNGRIDYYSLENAPEVTLPEEFYYDSINFTDENILEGSFRFSASVNQSGEACAGAIVVSSISFALINYDGALDFTGYKAQPYRGRICLQIYVNDANDDPVYLDLPVYYISSFRDNNGLIMIEAFDALDWLNTRPDPAMASDDTTAVEMSTAILEQCRPAPGGSGHTEGVEQILVPPDGYGNVTITTENVEFGSTTCAELLRQLAECSGSILQLEVTEGDSAISGNPPDQQLYFNEDYVTIPIANDAVIDCEILGKQKDVGQIRIYDYKDGTRYADSIAIGNDPQMVVISGNPFLFGDDGLGRADFIRALRRYQPHAYFPFTLTALCNPAIRPLDEISFTYHDTSYTTMVSEVDWTLGDYMTLSCAPQEQQTIEQSTPSSPDPSPVQPEVVPVEVETETITGVSSSLVTVYQYEGVVSVDVEITLTASISSQTLLADGLPKPLWTSRTEEVLYGTSYTRPLRFILNTSGGLNIRYGAAGTYYHHFTYLTNDGATPVTYPDADEEEF